MPEGCGAAEPLLSAWLDRALDPGEHAAVATHLRACQDCRLEVEGLARARAALRSLPVRHLPEDLAHPQAMRTRWELTRWGRRTPARPPAAGPGRGRGVRVGTRVATGVTLILGLAFAVGDDAPSSARAVPPQPVTVRLDALAREHLARAGGPVGAPALVAREAPTAAPVVLASAPPVQFRTGMATIAE